MENTLPNEFKGEGKTGRFWLSPYHLMEAKHILEIQQSRVKRGEREPLAAKWKQHAWGCGCCVCVSEFPKEEDPATQEALRINGIYKKSTRRKRTFHEVDGRRLKRIELPTGVLISL